MGGIIDKIAGDMAKKFEDRLDKIEKQMNQRFDEVGKKIDRLAEKHGKE